MNAWGLLFGAVWLLVGLCAASHLRVMSAHEEYLHHCEREYHARQQRQLALSANPTEPIEPVGTADFDFLNIERENPR